MSVTSGFFNSLNHDRRYNAQQMSAIFDGIINDGVFANIGVAFAITADSGVTINIGVGKAWFNSAWVYNDALLPKTLEGSEVVLDRIDAVVIEVDHNESVRMGDIKIVKGTPSSSPKNPTMANETNKHQYPLAYIYRKAGSTMITQADITNMVGTSSCPYITGILQVQSIDNIVAQWEGQWNQWYAEKIAETDSDASELLAEMKSEFDIWFNDIQALLEDDVATALAAQVAELQSKFDTLAKEGCVYDTIEDSDLDPILGSDGTPIQGKTVLGGGGNAEDIDLSAYAKKEDLEKVAETKLDRTEKYARNLLDNSDFTNPVNQRGYVSGTAGSAKYTIDRWKLQYSTNMGLEPDCISLWGHWSMWQHVNAKIEKGKIYTLAAYVKGETGNENAFLEMSVDGSGRLIGHTEDNIGTSWKIIAVTVTADRDIAVGECKFNVGINNGNGQSTKTFVRWVALYEGEYTAETLPSYQPKGYGAELLECMRYFYRFDYSVNGMYFTLVTGITQVPGFLFPVPMRVAPSMTIESLKTWTSSGFTDVSASISSKRCTKGGLQYIDLVSTAVTKGGVVALIADFSADLKME